MKTLIEDRTANQLLKTTPKKILERSRDILVKLKSKTAKGKMIYETVTISNRHKHRCFVRPLFKRNNENIVVSCDCENFKYVCEVSLYETNASIIKYSNGKNPINTNPSMRKKVCKHLVAVLEDYKRRQ